jgi:hypothetical protein
MGSEIISRLLRFHMLRSIHIDFTIQTVCEPLRNRFWRLFPPGSHPWCLLALDIQDSMRSIVIDFRKFSSGQGLHDRHWETTTLSGYKFERDGAQLPDACTLFHNNRR